MTNKTKKRYKRIFIALLLVIILSNLASAQGDVYKPYLHKPIVPENPGLNLQGTYQTALWPGAATYTYPIEVLPGINGLQPALSLNYNHHSTNQRPGIIGTAWTLSENYIFRDVDYSFTNISDDKFKLVLNGQTYDLVYDSFDERYHTEIESYLYIKNESGGDNDNDMYWIVKNTGGVVYRFGYYEESELVSNLHTYTTRWSLDLVTDTYDNNISYSYLEDPYTNDSGTVYPYKIEYNKERSRIIEFILEDSDRPDKWSVFEQGNNINYSRRIKEININISENLIRKYILNYTVFNNKSYLESISLYGNDGTTSLPPVIFGYYSPSPGWYYDGTYLLPNSGVLKFESDKNDYGVRLIDINRDGLIDITKADGKNPQDNQTWINTGSGWERDDSWNIPGLIVDSEQNDTGLRFIDFNGDGFTDIVRGDKAIRKSWQNNGNGWVENTTWHLPTNAQPVDSSDSLFERGVRFEDENRI